MVSWTDSWLVWFALEPLQPVDCRAKTFVKLAFWSEVDHLMRKSGISFAVSDISKPPGAYVGEHGRALGFQGLSQRNLMLVGFPVPTLRIVPPGSGFLNEATVALTTSPTKTKSRVCFPSPNIIGGFPSKPWRIKRVMTPA